LTHSVRQVGSVAHQPASYDELAVRKSRSNPSARRQGGNLHAARKKECVGADEKGIGAVVRKGGKCRIDLPDRSGIESLDLQPDSEGSLLHVPQCSFSNRSIGRVEEHGNTHGLGHQLMQECQQLDVHLLGENIHACYAAADEIGCERRKSIKLVLRMPILDRHVLALL
jgi:hypothetical protein